MNNPGPELFTAMLAFQSTNPGVEKGGKNPHFRSSYITLEDLTSVARACNQHGLVFFHRQEETDIGDVCVTTVAHAESGQSISTRVRLLYGKNDSQGQGSATTYARRYGLGQLLALCDTKDDDGEAAMRSSGYRGGNGRQDEPPPPTLPPKGEREGEHHPSFEHDQPRFFAILNSEAVALDYGELKDWCAHKGWPRPTQLTQSRRDDFIERLHHGGDLRGQFLDWKEDRP